MFCNQASYYFGNIVPLQQAVNALGVNANSLLDKAGIERSYSNSCSRRISHLKMSQFIEDAVRQTSPNIGLIASEYVNPAYFNAFGAGLLFSSDLRAFCRRFEEYFQLISTSIKVSFIDHSDECYLTFSETTDCSDIVSNYLSDAFSALIIKFLRVIISPNYSPEKVSLTWMPDCESRQQYYDLFDCEVEFCATKTAIHFNKKSLSTPLAGANLELAMTNDRLVTDLLEKSNSADLKSKAINKLVELLPTGKCSREEVAKSLNMSTSSFHAKLKQEGMNYQHMLDNLRQELAINYIVNENLTRETTAELLGYSDCSNFSRAFKRWLGMSLNEFKRRKSS